MIATILPCAVSFALWMSCTYLELVEAPAWLIPASYGCFGLLIWALSQAYKGKPIYDLLLTTGAAVSMSFWGFSIALTIIIALGAPMFPISVETHSAAALLGQMIILPFIWEYGPNAATWARSMRLATTSSELLAVGEDESSEAAGTAGPSSTSTSGQGGAVEAGSLAAMAGIGAWFGCLVLPMDWGFGWLKWPGPLAGGALAGQLLAGLALVAGRAMARGVGGKGKMHAGSEDGTASESGAVHGGRRTGAGPTSAGVGGQARRRQGRSREGGARDGVQ